MSPAKARRTAHASGRGPIRRPPKRRHSAIPGRRHRGGDRTSPRPDRRHGRALQHRRPTPRARHASAAPRCARSRDQPLPYQPVRPVQRRVPRGASRHRQGRRRGAADLRARDPGRQRRRVRAATPRSRAWSTLLSRSSTRPRPSGWWAPMFMPRTTASSASSPGPTTRRRAGPPFGCWPPTAARSTCSARSPRDKDEDRVARATSADRPSVARAPDVQEGGRGRRPRRQRLPRDPGDAPQRPGPRRQRQAEQASPRTAGGARAPHRPRFAQQPSSSPTRLRALRRPPDAVTTAAGTRGPCRLGPGRAEPARRARPTAPRGRRRPPRPLDGGDRTPAGLGAGRLRRGRAADRRPAVRARGADDGPRAPPGRGGRAGHPRCCPPRRRPGRRARRSSRSDPRAR